MHDPNVLRYSGEYDPISAITMSSTGANYQAVDFGSNLPTAHAWGGLNGENIGTRQPPGISRGDYYLTTNAGADVVGRVGDLAGGNNGSYLLLSPNDLAGNAIPAGSPLLGAGFIYRHKFANSLAARRQVFEQNRSVYQRSIGFQQRFFCWVTAVANGSITLRAVRGGPDELNIRDHVFLQSDLLCLPGVEGRAAGQDGLFGIGLGAATFTRSGTGMGLEVTIAVAGVDFRPFVPNAPAILLTKTARADDTFKYATNQRLAPANGTTAPQMVGMIATTATTISHPTPAVTNRLTATRRTLFTSAATAGTATGLYETAATRMQGSVNGIGGYKLDVIFGQEHNVAATQNFVGLTNSAAALAGEPSALLNIIGVGYDSGDATNWQLMRNDGSGTATKLALSGAGGDNGDAAMPRDTTTLYRMIIECRAGVAAVAVTIVNLSTGVKILDRRVFTSDIPANNALLAFRGTARNAAVASAVSVMLAGVVAGINELPGWN